MADPRKSRAGMLLYRHLPEEYRYRDNRQGQEQGDLEAYLDGFGVLLDAIRETIAQSYADAFAGQQRDGKEIQEWLVPYLADLLQAELVAPAAGNRRKELNNTVGWYKGKGTLAVVDGIADTVSGAQTVVVEGWRRTLITPRLSLPPFTIPPDTAGRELPLGTPDLRRVSRAVIDETGQNSFENFTLTEADATGNPAESKPIVWRLLSRTGAPCFPGHFDDRTQRTPAVGDFTRRRPGPHPRRTHVHVQPPSGLFVEGLKSVALTGADPLGIGAAGGALLTIDPDYVYERLGQGGPPDRLVLTGNLKIPAGARVILEDLLFMGKITVEMGARLEMQRSAARQVSLDKEEGELPMLDAVDCLFGEVFGPFSFAQLEYVTVLGDVTLARLNASDCLFVGKLVDFKCAEKDSCVRYSRLAEGLPEECRTAGNPNNTTALPIFVQRVFDDAGGCVVRTAKYGEPGCGVLSSEAPAAITAGAEDRGEMGAHHHQFHAAKLRAVRTKLADFLPVGQSITLAYDERLAVRPPVVTGL
ncbi:MAG: hypothetical protein WBA73_02870 [Devosia sp.]